MKDHPIATAALALALLAPLQAAAQTVPAGQPATSRTTEVPFTSYDGYQMFGKLTLPTAGGLHPVVIYVQTAEGATVDMKRPLGGTRTFNYYDLYREKLPPMNVGFFSYEGRGIRMGTSPPRFEEIDWSAYNTSTIDNKVRDILIAIRVVARQPGVDASRIFLMGASEGTLLAAQAASRAPSEVKGLILYAILSTTFRDAYKYMLTDGNFLMLRGYFDSDKDGKISQQEFDTDARRFRRSAMPTIGFGVFDLNGDGVYTVDEAHQRAKGVTDAVDAENFDIINASLKNAAVVSIPEGWARDEMSQPPMWTFLGGLTMPIGLFHGSGDNLTDIEGVRKLEVQAKAAGKTNMEFHYFEGLDHSLNIGEYFATGKMPAGHQAIFEFIGRQTK